MADLMQRVIDKADLIKQNSRMEKRAVRDMVCGTEDCGPYV